MEEEDSLDMAPPPTSRPVTPSPNDLSDGNGANQTPKAKSRVQPVNPFNHPNMTDEDPPNRGEPQDEYMSDEEEHTVEQIRYKLEDIMEELMAVRKSNIWPKLGATDWATYVMELIRGTRETRMDMSGRV